MAGAFVIFTALVLLGMVKGLPVSPSGDPTDVGLTADQMVTKHGYPIETHFLTTSDGYILTLHRIPHGIENREVAEKPAVLLMHGQLSSTADWVNMGPGSSLSYILADLGYDVWMGNARGNLNSRNHTTLDPDVDKEEFWDFSWHEIGAIDVAETIDFILETNGDENLYYVGHSQGTTTFFVLTTTRPEYNQKIRIASLMGAAAIFEHGDNSVVTQYLDEFMAIMKENGIFEFPGTADIRKWGTENCEDPQYQPSCIDFLNSIGGAPDEAQLDLAMLPVIFTNAPGSASMKQLYHYGQLIRAGGFSQFDYGPEENMERYGTETPPPYDFSLITTPIAFYSGNNDAIVNYQDVQTVISRCPNVINDYLVPYEMFNHIDFLLAKDVVSLLYEEVIAVMQQY